MGYEWAVMYALFYIYLQVENFYINKSHIRWQEITPNTR
jgi:hypothetical protein